MEITILFFGMLTDITTASKITLNDVQSTDEVIAKLNKQFPTLIDKSFRLAVNEQLILTNTILNNGDTVALLPPFSGG